MITTSKSPLKRSRRGFTLVELIVVIGILGVLMGVLISSLSGTSDSARAAKCLTNMRSLAMAALGCGNGTSYYPLAGSIEYMAISNSRGKSNSELTYNERKGWVSWSSKGKYPASSKSGAATIGFATGDDDEAEFALTNGAIWKYIGGSRTTYVCPQHAKVTSNVRWSYLMNAYFGWNAASGHAYTEGHTGIRFSSLSGADRILMFSEIPFQGCGDWFPSGNGSSTDSDGILQYSGCNKAYQNSIAGARNGNEHVGANHKTGKYWYAHVAFADGHTEKFRASTDKGTKLSSSELRDLTTSLCTGKAVTLDGSKYRELQ